ncbi:MAG TPA: PilZ domain-containing protein [Steroidobacteraceae bacterium]|nr:PilZ domain-containing protein [Steroidobacteraceae bacterium]
MFEGIDTVVLHDELALDDMLSCAWQALSEPLSIAVRSRYAEINTRVLQAAFAFDDQVAGDKSDDPVPQAADLVRLDAKLNLLIDMVGRLLIQNYPRPPLTSVRFNIRGATWSPANVDECQLNSTGTFEVYLQDYLVDPLRLIGTVTSRTAHRVDLKFEQSPEAIASLLEKYIFRRHRRKVADVKKPTASVVRRSR